MRSILQPCTGHFPDECPEVFVDDTRADRPFCITDIPDPRGMAWFTEDELLSLATNGSDTIGVTRGEIDTLIVDALGNELRVTNAQFEDLVASIKDGSAHEAMANAIDGASRAAAV